MASDSVVKPVVGTRAMTIRSHLFLLALAAVVPFLAFAVWVSVLLIVKEYDPSDSRAA